MNRLNAFINAVPWTDSMFLSMLLHEQTQCFYQCCSMNRLNAFINAVPWTDSMLLSMLFHEQRQWFYQCCSMNRLNVFINAVPWTDSMFLSMLFHEHTQCFYQCCSMNRLNVFINAVPWTDSMLLSMLFHEHSMLLAMMLFREQTQSNVVWYHSDFLDFKATVTLSQFWWRFTMIQYEWWNRDELWWRQFQTARLWITRVLVGFFYDCIQCL